MMTLQCQTHLDNHDEAQARQMYAEYSAAVLGFVIRLTGDLHSAEDIVQETLLRAWQCQHSIDHSPGAARGWLFRVARNIVIDRIRARSARATEVFNTNLIRGHDDDHADKVVDRMYVFDVMDRLSPEHRAVLAELYYNGRSVSDAAQTLGIPTGTVKSRAYYALRILRDEIRRRDRVK